MTLDSGKHVFISYVKEDAKKIDQLCKLLNAADIPYWRDKNELEPGVSWKQSIRDAIRSNSLVFLACFSKQSLAREKSYMNEELVLAIEEYRSRLPGKSWLIPVRLDDISLPDWDLGAGRTLSDLQYANLFGDVVNEEGLKLALTINKIMGGPAPDAATLRSAVSEADVTRRPVLMRQLTKDMVTDPTRRIELDDLISEELSRIRMAMRDENQFPIQTLVGSQEERILHAAALANSYWELVKPLCWSIQVAARWSNPETFAPWISAVRGLASEAADIRNGGNGMLLGLRHIPALCAMFTATLAAVGQKRWDNVRALVLDTTIMNLHRERLPLIDAITYYAPFENHSSDRLPQLLARSVTDNEDMATCLGHLVNRRKANLHTPVADWLHHLLRPAFNEQFPDDELYDQEFDTAEIFLGVLSQDQAIQQRTSAERAWPSRSQWFGRSTWRSRDRRINPVEELADEVRSRGATWGPLSAGLFGGNADRATTAITEYAAPFQQINDSRW